MLHGDKLAPYLIRIAGVEWGREPVSRIHPFCEVLRRATVDPSFYCGGPGRGRRAPEGGGPIDACCCISGSCACEAGQSSASGGARIMKHHSNRVCIAALTARSAAAFSAQPQAALNEEEPC